MFLLLAFFLSGVGEESHSFLSAFLVYSFINNALLFKSHKIMGTVKTSRSDDKRQFIRKKNVGILKYLDSLRLARNLNRKPRK